MEKEIKHNDILYALNCEKEPLTIDEIAETVATHRSTNVAKIKVDVLEAVESGIQRGDLQKYQNYYFCVSDTMGALEDLDDAIAHINEKIDKAASMIKNAPEIKDTDSESSINAQQTKKVATKKANDAGNVDDDDEDNEIKYDSSLENIILNKPSKSKKNVIEPNACEAFREFINYVRVCKPSSYVENYLKNHNTKINKVDRRTRAYRQSAIRFGGNTDDPFDNLNYYEDDAGNTRCTECNKLCFCDEQNDCGEYMDPRNCPACLRRKRLQRKKYRENARSRSRNNLRRN